jgi:carboxypeptidase family protein
MKSRILLLAALILIVGAVVVLAIVRPPATQTQQGSNGSLVVAPQPKPEPPEKPAPTHEPPPGDAVPTSSQLAISGYVLSADGESIAGVSVTATGRRSSEATVTREDGAFTIEGLRSGPYTLDATKAAFSPARARNIRAGGSDVYLTLHALSTISGSVVDARSGRPITTFELANFRSGSPPPRVGDKRDALRWSHLSGWTSLEGDDGRFSLIGIDAPETWTVVARADDYAYASTDVKIEAGQHVDDVRLELEPAGRIVGRVNNMHGHPVRDASIFLTDADKHPSFSLMRHLNTGERDPGDSTVQTAANGSFSLAGLAPGRYDLVVFHPAYISKRMFVHVESRRIARADFTLEEGGSVEGVVSVDGEPLASATVRLYVLPGLTQDDMRETTTGDDGKFRFESIGSGAVHVALILSATAVYAQEVETPSGETTIVDFPLVTGNAAIRGTVFVDGQRVAQAELELDAITDIGRFTASAHTDPDGSYHFGSLPAGVALLTVVAPSPDGRGLEQNADLDITAGQVIEHNFELYSQLAAVSGVLLTLQPGETGTVQAVQGGVDLDSITPADYLAMQARVAATATLDEAGGFRFERLEPGAYTLLVTVWPEGDSPGPADDPLQNLRATTEMVQVEEGKETHVELRFR